MEAKIWQAGDRECRVYGGANARYVLVQMADGHDLQGMDREAEIIAGQTDAPFLLIAVPVADWNRELSPWEAPPVFGCQGFGGGAGETRAYLRQTLLPALRWDFSPSPDARLILGGYSLAGLFALWCGHTGADWDGVAAASPSVWFPGFDTFAAWQPMGARAVYLSLGDREERTRHPVMSRVGDRIRALHTLYESQPGMQTALEWNEGNHFREPEARMARAFLWVMEHIP